MIENNSLVQNKVEIFVGKDNQTQINVQFEKDTVWLNRWQIATLFNRDIKTIGKHINNVFTDGELDKTATVANFATVQSEGKRKVERQVEYYNLDVIISIGYRVKSKNGVKFRQWATQRLKDYLVKGYAINEKRLQQKEQEVIHLKTGIQILSRAIESKHDTQENELLHAFAHGLALLDDYDHQVLDTKGNTTQKTVYPTYTNYIDFIELMYSDFESDVFAKPKDESFHSSINQIQQSFGGQELYPTIQEKAANLLYYVVKNHSFVDGNKRIAAACFLLFLEQNNMLKGANKTAIISNETLASITLFIATSKSDEANIVKHFVISVLNKNTSKIQEVEL